MKPNIFLVADRSTRLIQSSGVGYRERNILNFFKKFDLKPEITAVQYHKRHSLKKSVHIKQITRQILPLKNYLR